ncbi:sporulation integral membrane protein YlbJ [Xylanivirga thermophila]|uniref:sporulation integral membrane protein YlbJ n=2 Tax=Xylanivirga thermophila TaxID=2496273 RepID=UPI00101CC3D9|nr:sporulation integral membrane protein YlbJ [Xylanivirga thermophila]
MNIKLKDKVKTASFACVSLAITLLIIAFPQESFKSALYGLESWLKIVFPALLPFLICSEVLIGTGVVNFLSTLLSPIMYPLFRCPGSSSFIWAMSAMSGYPMGAKLVAELKQKGDIDKIQGQRILSFCSTSGPLFMAGAVGVGMLGSQQAANCIMAGHYASAIVLGLMFRFYGSNSKKQNYYKTTHYSLNNAFENMHQARQKDGRTIAELLGDAVRNSINTQLMIGGFIVLYSVIIDLLIQIGFISFLSNIFKPIMVAFKLDDNLLNGLTGGLFEMTIGCKLISQSLVPIEQKVFALSFLIGWSGFSIHSQVASLLAGTNISVGIYVLSKLLHGIMAAIFSSCIMAIFYNQDVTTFNQNNWFYDITWSERILASFRYIMNIITILLLLGLILNGIIRLCNKNKTTTLG